MYLIAACLIAMRPLASYLLPRKLKDITTSLLQRSSKTTRISPHISKRETAVELGAFDVSRVRTDGFHELRHSQSQEPLKAGGGATADGRSIDLERLGGKWPAKIELDDAVHVRREIWVTASPNK